MATTVLTWGSSDGAGEPPGEGGDRLELADLRRVARRWAHRAVREARAEERPSFATVVAAHLGRRTHGLPVAEEQWAAYEHVNVQAALDAWLAEPGRQHEVVGITGHRHRGPFGFADLLDPDSDLGGRHGVRPGNVARVARDAGPDGRTLDCWRAVVLLVTEPDDARLAVLVRTGDRDEGETGVRVEVVGTAEGHGRTVTTRLRELAVVHNVHRGQVVSFGHAVFGERSSALRFHPRPQVRAEDLVLPQETFDDVRRQVVGVAEHRDRLRASGQHLKRGLLLYGPPGVGKTHTVRYLTSVLREVTVVQLNGDSLMAISEACSIARTLQPAMIVVEDVDLVAEQRDHYGGQTPLLFTLLNEMDGLAEDADVVFLLTTNRADLLEEALASRPGRVDQAVHVALPDRDARRRLVELYRGGIDLDTSRLDTVLDRTEGVTASFLKELLRRAAVRAVGEESEAGYAGGAGPLRVDADQLDAALADLLDTRNAMTRRVLGHRDDRSGPPAPHDRGGPPADWTDDDPAP